MTQPPRPVGGRPTGGQPGHPEPQPAPDPDPPQPIPPPDPAPPPEPPHAADAAPAPAAGDDPTAAGDAGFIDAGPATTELTWPPAGAYPGEATPTGADATEVWPASGSPAAAAASPDTTAASPETTAALPAARSAEADPTERAGVPPQSSPAEPWHARHEKPGEWRHEPPEHLAFEHSPPAEVADPTAAVPVTAGPAESDAEATMRRRRTGLWASVALSVTLLLCGGGAASAYLLLRNADSGGAPDPASAVNHFLTAVYTQQDPESARGLVCREARDADRLAARIEKIKDYANEYDGPSFRWTEPEVSGRTDERATVSVQLTMTTDDEKTAQQRLTFTTVRKVNWQVCEISG